MIEEWPSYIAYLVSFFTIGGVWIAHSVITESLDRVDPFFLRLNLILLLVVGFLPVPTGLAAEYLRSTDGERVAATLYGLTLLGIRLMIMVLWRYGLSRRLLRPDMSDEDVEGLTQKLTPSLAAYAVAIGIGLAVPTVAVALYLAIALYLVIDFRSAVRAVRRSGSP